MKKTILTVLICLQVMAGFAQLSYFTCDESKMGYKDKTGKIVIPCLHYSGMYEGGNEIVLTLNEKIIIYDATTGRKISDGKYDDYKGHFGLFKEGFAAVNTGGKWGFIDRNGKEITAIKYDSVHFFQEGFAIVCVGKKQGVIDNKAKEIVPPKYDKIDDFKYGRAKVSLNNQEYWIDRKGKIIIPEEVEFKNMTYQNALVLSKKTGKPVLLFCNNDHCCRSAGVSNTLKNQDVAIYLNANFICIKAHYSLIDNKITDTVTKNGYINLPALFIINSNGELMQKSTADGDCDSYIKDDELLNMAKRYAK